MKHVSSKFFFIDHNQNTINFNFRTCITRFSANELTKKEDECIYKCMNAFEEAVEIVATVMETKVHALAHNACTHEYNNTHPHAHVHVHPPHRMRRLTHIIVQHAITLAHAHYNACTHTASSTLTINTSRIYRCSSMQYEEIEKQLGDKTPGRQ